MFKKHMVPLQPHTKKGSLDNTPDKGSSQRNLPAAATGGGPSSFQSYGKATPMAQPAPAPDGIGSGSWPGNAIA
jgi:hypothetical protein